MNDKIPYPDENRDINNEFNFMFYFHLNFAEFYILKQKRCKFISASS